MVRRMAWLLLWVLVPAQVAADPCALPEVPRAEIQHALGMLGHAPPPRVVVPPSRFRGLLPTRLSVTVRNGVFDQTGYYLGATSLSERLMSGTDTGFAVRMDWDLRPLWWLPAAPYVVPDQHLARAERAEHLAERIALQLNQLRKAESLALQVSEGDLLCREARSDAEAALLVIEAVLNAARP